MANKNKDEIEDKLLEDLDEYEESSGSKKLIMIAGGIAGVLVIVALVLSFVGGNKKETPVSEEVEEVTEEEKVELEEKENSRASETDEKAYPPKTSGSRVPVDSDGNLITSSPIQKSIMIDNGQNPMHALHVIAPDVYELMEINIYDKSNSALSFSSFVDRTRMNMPEGLFNRLDNFYRIFMYRARNESGPGTAMVFSSSIPVKEKQSLMRTWEKSMVDDLKPFVMIGLENEEAIKSGSKIFQNSGIYDGGRYVDFDKEGVVSLNYLVYDKYIVVSNSRSTFERVVDLLKK